MQFVRRDAGAYYLHQVDRDYAMGRIPKDYRQIGRWIRHSVHTVCVAAPGGAVVCPDSQAARDVEDAG